MPTHEIQFDKPLMWQPPTLVLVVLTLLFVQGVVVAQTGTKNNSVAVEFLAWSRQNLHPLATVDHGGQLSDLEPLRDMIGNATVVSFGEGLHGGAEPLEFRNLLFRFLVEKMGFTAIAIESGITDGYVVNQYVLGGPGDLQSVVTQGFTSGFNTLPQEATLVQWMREYNADPKHSRKIEFYGFDVPPSDPKMALEDALRYLDGVDSAASTALRSRAKAVLPMLNLDRVSDRPNQYSRVSQSLRDQLTATIADMNTLFKLREDEYTAASSERAYQLAHHSAVVALQVDEYFRQVPIGWTPKEGIAAVSGTTAVSDRSKADNAYWIKEHQGPDGKVLLFAHRDHIAAALTSIRIPEHNLFHLPPVSMFPIPPLMGTYLQRRYGVHLVTIGNLLAQDSSNCKQKRAPAPSGSLEDLLSTLDRPFFVLDLRTAPQGVTSWLRQTHELYGIDLPDSLNVGKAFDIIFFSRLVTPARPCP